MEEKLYCKRELHELIIFLTKSAVAQEDRNPFVKTASREMCVKSVVISVNTLELL